MNTLIFALLLGQPASMDLNVYDFVDPAEDCAPRGAAWAPQCDLSPAFERAQRYCRDEVIWDAANTRLGCRYAVPPGKWLLSKRVTVCRQDEIHGVGGWGDGPRTQLYTLTGTTAFAFMSHGYCQKEGLGHGATYAEIRDLGLRGTLGPSIVPYYGIFTEARILIERVNIMQYVHGIHIEADARRVLVSNANMWQIRDVRIHTSAHAGVWADGGDTNVGVAVNLDATGNCFRASMWAREFGECANVKMSDFLGSTLIGAHTATAKDYLTGKRYSGYFFEGPNNRGLCLGCYAEGDQELSFMPHTGNVIGGLSGWTKDSPVLQGWVMNGAVIRNARDPNNIVDVFLGGVSAPGAFFELRAHTLTYGWPLRVKAEPARGAYRFDVANLGSGVFMRVGGTKDAGLGTLQLRGE